MPGKSPEPSGAERRTHPRVETRLRADIRLPDGKWLSSETIENISLGGVCIEMGENLKFGTDLELEFELPGAGTIRCGGTVVWARSQDIPGEKTHIRPGVGVRLTRLGVAEMRKLAEYIDGKLQNPTAKR